MSFYYLSEHVHRETRKLTVTHLESLEERADANDPDLWDEDDFAGKGIADLRLSLAKVRQAAFLWQKASLGGCRKSGTEVYKSWTPGEGVQCLRFSTRDRVIGSTKTYSLAGWGSNTSPRVLARPGSVVGAHNLRRQLSFHKHRGGKRDGAK